MYDPRKHNGVPTEDDRLSDGATLDGAPGPAPRPNTPDELAGAGTVGTAAEEGQRPDEDLGLAASEEKRSRGQKSGEGIPGGDKSEGVGSKPGDNSLGDGTGDGRGGGGTSAGRGSGQSGYGGANRGGRGGGDNKELLGGLQGLEGDSFPNEKPAGKEAGKPGSSGAKGDRGGNHVNLSGHGGGVVDAQRGGYHDPADAVTMEYDVGVEKAGPMELFLAAGKKMPVLLLTCNRDVLLRRTIQVRLWRRRCL